MSASEMDRPVQNVTVAPEVDPDTAPWWESLARGELWIPRCEACATAFFPPLPRCPHCGSADIAQVPSSGAGRLYSWVVIHKALDPAFAAEVPYTVVAVTLDEGVRMFGRITDGELADGLRVRAVPYVVAGTTLLGFVRSSDH